METHPKDSPAVTETPTLQALPSALPEFPGVINVSQQACYTPQYTSVGQGNMQQACFTPQYTSVGQGNMQQACYTPQYTSVGQGDMQQACYTPQYTSVGQGSMSQSGHQPVVPLQPYLYPPMMMPYPSLSAARVGASPYMPEYIMPRIVSIRNQDQSFLNLMGTPQGSLTPSQGPGTISYKDMKKRLNAAVELVGTNAIKSPGANEDPQDGSEGNMRKLPGINNFLDVMGPDGSGKMGDEEVDVKEKEKGEDEHKEGEDPVEDKQASKKMKLDLSNSTDQRTMSPLPANLDMTEPGGGKSPLAVSQAPLYFMNIDEEMEEMAFDPKAKPNDRHNAKERHRRVRISKAADFFRDTLPCMSHNMDKAAVFQLAVYYLIYLRNGLHQHDPQLLKELHKTYRQEWETHFNLQDTRQ